MTAGWLLLLSASVLTQGTPPGSNPATHLLLITGLTLVGEGLNETLNPSLRRRRLVPVTMPPLQKTERTR